MTNTLNDEEEEEEKKQKSRIIENLLQIHNVVRIVFVIEQNKIENKICFRT